MGLVSPGNRSFVEPSELIEKTVPSCLKMYSCVPVWRSALMPTDGSPTKNGPDQLPATLGSEVTLRMTDAFTSAAHNSVPTTSRRWAEKPLGRLHAVQVLSGFRS